MGIRVGVVGTGKLGREHVRIFHGLEGVDFVGCYDVSPCKLSEVAQRYQAQAFSSLDELLSSVDAVTIATPTIKHYEISLLALEKGRDVFIEKPIAARIGEALEIVERASSNQRILQVGHIERFNPAFIAACENLEPPSFIEAERLGPFSLRGTDVSVVADLMVHDLDLILVILGEWPVEIRAKGAEVISSGPDIVNARLEFPSGCVADLTASRISMEPSRKFRIFSPGGYTSIDLKNKRIKQVKKAGNFQEKVSSLRGSQPPKKPVSISDLIDVKEFQAEGEEPLLCELRSFVGAVNDRSNPMVTGEDGLRVLKLASEILKHLKLENIS